jgi:TorA maturation chaperone TorD
MPKHSHRFVETFGGLAGYGLDRQSNENTVRFYLQKLSDDGLTEALLPRMTDEDLEAVFELTIRLLKKHLTNREYHELFLKDGE